VFVQILHKTLQCSSADRTYCWTDTNDLSSKL